MALKPNYRHQRAERNRAKEEKKQEKLRRREEKVAERKAARDGQPGAGEETQDDDMAHRIHKKHTADIGFVLFDVVYEDGSRSSNRKVPGTVLGGPDGDAPARAHIEAQDRKIAEVSGRPRGPIKSIVRSSRA
jgi:hypothetical protein